MTRFDRILPHLPELRRYAYVSTGSRQDGDLLVRACLEALIAAPEMIDGNEPRIALFRLFHMINGVPSLSPLVETGEQVSDEVRLFLQFGTIGREERSALALVQVIGISMEDAAQILDTQVAEIRRRVAKARTQLARMVNARVLIIEDDFLIAQEISRIVENLGQRVSGPAASYREAMACAAEEAPTLVLADIQLRDGRSAGLRAGVALAREHCVPLIVITAYPERLAQEAEVAPYEVLTKPFNYAALRTAIATSMAPLLPA